MLHKPCPLRFIPTNEITYCATAALSCVFVPETHFWRIHCLIQLTCTLRPADQRRSRCSGTAVPWPGKQNTDAVLSVWLQMPNFIGEWAHTVSLRPHGLAGPVLDFPPNDWSVPDYGVGVELDDQIRGACPQELWGSDWCWGHCNKEYLVSKCIILLEFSFWYCSDWYYFETTEKKKMKIHPQKHFNSNSVRHFFSREQQSHIRKRRSQGLLSLVFSFLFYSFNNIIFALLEHRVIKIF